MPAEQTGTRVTCEDLATRETESKVVRDDYVIVTDGLMEISAMQVYGNGTTQVTLKRRKGANDAG